MHTALVSLVVGSVGGLVAALCGVGGGIIMVPAFVLLLGLPQKTAVATSLAIIIPTAIAATTQNTKLVDWKIFAGASVGAVVVAVIASDWMKSLSNLTLSRIFAVLLIAVGVRMLFSKG